MQDYNYILPISYCYNAMAFGAGTLTKKILGPSVKRGRVLDLAVMATTAFVGTTTPANLQIGVSGTLASMMTALNMGTTGVPLAVNTSLAKALIEAAYVRSRAGNVEWAYSANDIEVLVTGTVGVGSPAGAADVMLTLGWY